MFMIFFFQKKSLQQDFKIGNRDIYNIIWVYCNGKDIEKHQHIIYFLEILSKFSHNTFNYENR